MFKKSTLLALAGALTLGVAMVSAGSADARGHGGGGGGFSRGGGGGFHGGAIRGGGIRGGGIAMVRHPRHPGIRIHPRWPRPHWHVHHRRHYWVAPVATYAVARPVIAAPGPCTCLTKEYTPEGAVLFKDRCTNEAAINPPVQAAPQQMSEAPAPVYQTAPAQPQQAYVPTYPGPAAQGQPVAR
jgi:hypothetical protein